MAPDPVTLTPAAPTREVARGLLHPPAPSAGNEVPVPVPSAPPKKRLYRASRKKPPKDSKVYKAVLATIALRAQGAKYDDIATQLHLTKSTIQTYLKRAHRKGWINADSFDDPEDALEVVLKDKVVKNLNSVLGETVKREVKVGEDVEEVDTGILSDRAVDVSLEIAKGTGLLKQHQVVKGEGSAPNVFALKVQVEMPPATGAPTPVVKTGQIGGQPFFDAEVIEAKEE